MFFLSPPTWKMVKDYPNHIPTDMIGLAQTSREIIDDSDIPILPVVLFTLDSVKLTAIVPVPHYTPTAHRLIQSVYGHMFSDRVQHLNPCLELYKHYTVIICRLF